MTKVNNNLSLWNDKAKPEPKATQKKDRNGNLAEAKDQNGNSSINSYYMFEAATALFGPVGVGWGYEILEDKRELGCPQLVGNEVHREESHTIRLKLWYVHEGEPRYVENYGHTKALYWSNKWKSFVYDEEAPKKSLTDAIKKCLSMIGVYSDVYKGMLEDFEYQQERLAEAEINNFDTQQEKDKGVRLKLKEIIDDAVSMMGSCVDPLQTDSVLAKFSGKINAYAKVDPNRTQAALDNLRAKHEKIKAEKAGVTK
jgi:hypothetical protein